MHIPDGFVSPALTVPAFGVAAPLWAYAAKRYFGPSALEALPVMGSLTALAFVVQTIMIPVPGGTTTHLVGSTLLALVFHPLVAFVCESLVLLLQALFFGAGGVTVLGINALAMGLLGPLIGWLLYKGLRRFGPRVAAFAAAYAGMQVSTLAAALVLGLQHWLAPSFFPLPFAVTATAMALPSLTVAGLAEGGFTVAVLALLDKAKLRALG